MADPRIDHIISSMKEASKKPLCIMEVCGTHTMSIARFGIRSVLPRNVRVISGPGCPVCVTPSGDIATAIELAKRDDVVVATFGDMIKVPGGGDSLSNYKNVKIIYSPLDALRLSQEQPSKEVVLLGIGFETTAPLIGATIQAASKANSSNFSVLCMHKTIPAAMRVILEDSGSQGLGGLILPGHVSAVTGSKYYDFMKSYGVSGVITGFDALNILEAIYALVVLYGQCRSSIINHYHSVVSEGGNRAALSVIKDVFEPCDSSWRGIGRIPLSGLRIRDTYAKYDALKKFDIKTVEIPDPKGCLCGSILMGKSQPTDCEFFGKACKPNTPIGPCMVSSEGTCAAYYKYGI